ncbi:hypothetical protein VITU102760_07845 [Vibrio tubiashii]|uniref:Uncharacterized protein n=1 Tax=Vibrio tubiashii ATCC 19109 TaxID=1051646 RepID=F9T8X6_9VIBR|nr:hypothetical protein IX91_08705 [Vibrio tubiashii ATCC 19109]EGU52066.1 hypothetical protein VITU9109_17023 [Vibrio tubiashii ATCC 19109]EIF03836.1 hypothetical protein VT1337_10292 [Vibrio tubiashii NCIMB 1337 = ATCC 19106]
MKLIKALKPLGWLLLHFFIGVELAYISIILIAIFGAGYDGTIEEIQRDELMINVVYAVFILYQCWSVYRFGYKGLVPKLIKSRNQQRSH